MPTKIIEASAGSGKTYQLAVAYLQALLAPLPDGSLPLPQQVLATTFTRAAAAEILERVLHRLAHAVLSDEALQRLLIDIERPDLRHADIVRLLESVCKVLPQLQVGTIDGLFARVVRAMGLDLAFPAAWNVAGGTQAEELALAAADRMLHGEDVEDSLGHWNRYTQFKPGLRVRAALVELLEDTRFLLNDTPAPEAFSEVAEPQKISANEATQLAQALTAFDLPKNKTGKPNEVWRKAVLAIQSALTSEATLISILKGHTLISAASQENGSYSKVPVPSSLRDILNSFIELARADLTRLHNIRLPALAALARRYDLLRREVAYSSAAYTFREIEAAVWPLPTHIHPDDLYFRLDGKIQHLLLDEFQDTSLSQFRFLWPIIKEIRDNDRLFFAVGDVKQSIYGWRGAERRLLTRLQDWLDPHHQDPHLIHERLPHNRRSSPAVLAAINRIFKNLDQAECLNPEPSSDKTKQQRIRARKRAAASFIEGYEDHVAVGENKLLAGRVRLLMPQAEEDASESEDEESPDEIGIIIKTVLQHLRENPRREIAILCRRHKLMPAILAGLQRKGVAASGEGGNPVTDSNAVEIVLSMLTWVDHPGHSLAHKHVELSGVATVFGADGTLQDWALPSRCQVSIMRRGLAAVISDWVRHEQFRRFCTVHDQVRAEQLIELARHWDAAGGGRLSDFVEQVRSQRVDNPASSRVRVMTIHGSKGLEFEAVILADLETKGRGGDGPQLIVTMTNPDVPPTVTLLPKAEDAEWLGLQDIYERHQQDKFEEDLSVLYVALTRAKSFLDVVLPTDDKPKASLSAIIRERWGHQDAGEYIIEECAATGDMSDASPSEKVSRDNGIWQKGDSLTIANLQTVPKRLEAITPSGQEGSGIVNLGQLLKTGNTQALERGTAVHALFSRIEWISDLPPLDEWIRSIPTQEANAAACRSAARELYPRLLNSTDALAPIFDADAWMQRWQADGVTQLEVWRERRFVTIVNQELMNGSFDRVVIGLNATGERVRADILDFKTDRFTNEAEREERRFYYQPQLDAYINALHQLTRLPVASIHAELVWLHSN